MSVQDCTTCAHGNESSDGPKLPPLVCTLCLADVPCAEMLTHARACAARAQGEPAPPATKGIGDVTSSAKGSGARYNAGKPPFDLLPLSLVALSFPGDASEARTALEHLGAFQVTHDAMHLSRAIRALGLDAWPEAAQVFEYGRAKYAAWNWAKGMPWSAPLACAGRHLFAMLRGEATDPESGKPHRGHVLCNLVMLMTYTATYKEGNDLPPVGSLGV